MKNKKIISILLLISMGIIAMTACKTLQNIGNTLTNIKDLQFKLKSVNNYKLAGISIAKKSSINDFSITDGLKLAGAFSSKRLPAEFVLNVEARNPNDGSGNTKSTTIPLESLKWTLYIDNVRTIEGDITNTVEIPGKGGSTIIPIFINLDLYDFFSKRGYDGIVKLALTLGGVEGNTSSIRLEAKPVIRTPLGPIGAPRITIVDHKFSS